MNMPSILEKILTWAVALVAKFGYGGIFLTMALESAAIPIPSEVVLPFAGFLASSGQLNFWLVVLTATVANLAGAAAIYLVGIYGGRPLLEKYGHYVLISEREISKVENWLVKYQEKAAFFSRLLPGVRTFSSLLFGAARLNFKKFVAYTLAGSVLWNLALTYVGLLAGDRWNTLRPYFQKFELGIAAAILILIAVFLYRHLKRAKK